MLHVNCMAAEVQGDRHGERDKPDILAGKEQYDKIRMSIGDESDMIAAFQVHTEKTASREPGLLLQIGVWQDDAEPASCIIKIAPGNTCGRVVKGFRQT